MKRLIVMLAMVSLLGCNAVGSKKYGCTGLPEGVKCMATRDLYEQTHGGATQGSTGSDDESSHARQDSGEQRNDGEVAATSPMQLATDPVVNQYVTPNLPDRPVPIRTPAQVMRIWVASWEDASSGSLMTPGYIYTEIEPRRWVIGKTEAAASAQGRLFKPLESSGTQTR